MCAYYCIVFIVVIDACAGIFRAKDAAETIAEMKKIVAKYDHVAKD